MHDMIKWIVESVIRGEFWHDESSWGLIIDNVSAERLGEHVIQLPADRAGGPLLATSPPICCSGGCGG